MEFYLFTWEAVRFGIFQEVKRRSVKVEQCSHQTLGNSQPQLGRESGC